MSFAVLDPHWRIAIISCVNFFLEYERGFRPNFQITLPPPPPYCSRIDLGSLFLPPSLPSSKTKHHPQPWPHPKLLGRRNLPQGRNNKKKDKCHSISQEGRPSSACADTEFSSHLLPLLLLVFSCLSTGCLKREEKLAQKCQRRSHFVQSRSYQI